MFNLPRPLYTPPASDTPDRNFCYDEDGALTIFGLILLVMMMVAGGFALDIMRSEADRAHIQYTIDRAVLAAASLGQDRDGEVVVRDYLHAAGLSEDVVTIASDDTGNAKRVDVIGESVVDSLFLGILGHDQLYMPVSAEAQEEETDLEVSLVLDISGSMGGTKLINMRTAASNFVAELLIGREDTTSISLVPYNDRVNLGSLNANFFPLSDEHELSNCIVFSDAEFEVTGLAAGTVLQRMGHFDKDTGNSNTPGAVDDPMCRTDDYGAVLAFSNNVTTLQTQINALGAGDWTAMDLGVKVGTLLLDPSMQDEAEAMIAAGDVAADMTGRPMAYDAEDSRKVLVVMTDGRNTTQWDLDDDKKDGPSGIFVYRSDLVAPGSGGEDGGTVTDSASGENTSSNNGGSNWRHDWQPTTPFGTALQYWFNQWANGNGWGWGRGNTASSDGTGNSDDGDAWWDDVARGGWLDWDDDVDGDGTSTETYYSVWSEDQNAFYVSHLNAYYSEPYGTEDAVELSFAELFSALPTNYIEQTLLDGADQDTRNKYGDAWSVTARQRDADANLSMICSKAREAGITVYTIAFQAPSDGITAMQNCAGTANSANFFKVEDLDIDSAFDDIVSSINRLKLTR